MEKPPLYVLLYSYNTVKAMLQYLYSNVFLIWYTLWIMYFFFLFSQNSMLLWWVVKHSVLFHTVLIQHFIVEIIDIYSFRGAATEPIIQSMLLCPNQAVSLSPSFTSERQFVSSLTLQRCDKSFQVTIWITSIHLYIHLFICERCSSEFWWGTSNRFCAWVCVHVYVNRETVYTNVFHLIWL